MVTIFTMVTSSYGYNKIINEITKKSTICTDDEARPYNKQKKIKIKINK